MIDHYIPNLLQDKNYAVRSLVCECLSHISDSVYEIMEVS